MAQRSHSGTGEVLDEIQSAADRLGDFLQKNLVAVVASVLGLLALVGLVSYLASARARSEEKASIELADARAEYLKGMGAAPGALEVPELANPEAARRVREAARARYGEIADGHAGTVSGALARLEVADMMLRDGEVDAALETFGKVRAEAPSRASLQGLILQREGQALEQAGRPAEAAERYEQAAALEGFPLRDYALADAARTRALAGDTDAARKAYEKLATQAPDLNLPEYQRQQRRELELSGK